MIELRVADYNDKEYDSCGNTTIAILENDGISIALCEECVNDLIQTVEKFKNTVYCKDCMYWYCSKYGVKYNGTCIRKIPGWSEGVNITELLPESEYGQQYATEFMNTCENSKRK